MRDKFKEALDVTCDARNRANYVRGSSSAQWALGDQWERPILDEAQRTAEIMCVKDRDYHFADPVRRVDARAAYLKAATSEKIKVARLARVRPERRPFSAGEW